MQVVRTSMNTNRTTSLDLPITEDQLECYQNGGGAIQDIFPNLCAGLREFIKTGVSPKEWKEMFGQCGNGKCNKKCLYLEEK